MFRKILLLPFAVVFLFAVQTFAQNVLFTPLDLAGTYSIHTPWDSYNITLNPDGTYSMLKAWDMCVKNSEESNECINYYKESGSFSVEGNLVRFHISQYNPFDFEGKLRDKPPENHELLVIKWSERFYLVEKNSLKEFADAVNMKLEPRRTLSARKYAYFYLRREGIEKPLIGLPELPDGWTNYLLKKPVKAVILKINRKGENHLAVINKGSRAGLKVGMKIVTGYFPDGSEVISVTRSSATVKLNSQMKKGDKVRTYHDPDNWRLGAGFISIRDFIFASKQPRLILDRENC